MSATAFQRMRREAALRAASVDLEDMEIEQLIEYADKAGVSLGKASSREGILKKINDARVEVKIDEAQNPIDSEEEQNVSEEPTEDVDAIGNVEVSEVAPEATNGETTEDAEE